MQQLNQLKAKFYSLENSEQKILLVGAFAVLFFILYTLVYKPLSHSIEQLSMSNSKNAELLVWMKQSVATIKARGNQGSKDSKRGNRSFNQVINTSAATAKITISRSQPRNNKQYQIWLDRVNFNDLISWLKVLNDDYAITVDSINLGKTDSNGMVRASITFQDFGV